MNNINEVADIVKCQGLAITLSVIIIVLVWLFGRSSLSRMNNRKSLIDLYSQTNEAILKFTETLKFCDNILNKYND